MNQYKALVIISIGFNLLFYGCKESNPPAEENEIKTYPIALVETLHGSMYFWLYDETPNHKEKFIELANEGHYNQFTFNRIIRNFVVQGGCPDSPQYFTDSPYLLDPEFVDSLKHIYGALGMGRDNNAEKRSNACQFYIVNKETGLPNLDGDYMIFGKLIKGKSVLETIEGVPTNSTDEPVTRISIVVSIGRYSDKQLLDSFDFVRP